MRTTDTIEQAHFLLYHRNPDGMDSFGNPVKSNSMWMQCGRCLGKWALPADNEEYHRLAQCPHCGKWGGLGAAVSECEDIPVVATEVPKVEPVEIRYEPLDTPKAPIPPPEPQNAANVPLRSEKQASQRRSKPRK